MVSYTTSQPPRNGSMLFHTDMVTDTTYFLHRFGPGQAELGGHLDREVVFLLDKSGSMGSGKLDQLKAAFGETEAGKARVMELAREWNFVTPNTAMVVTESGPWRDPEEPGSTNDPEDTSSDDPAYYDYEDPTTDPPTANDDAEASSDKGFSSSVSSILVVGLLALMALTLRRKR